MRLFLLVLAFTAACAMDTEGYGLTCLKYSCGNWTNTATCLMTNSTNVSILPCAPPMICNTATSKCVQPTPAPVVAGWPGEPCSAGNPCAYGTCADNGICRGAPVGSACTKHDQCDTGLMCNSTSYCSPLLPGGTAGCRSTFDCDYFSVCNKTFTNATGTCLERGTIQLTQTVTDCNNSFSLLCETNACIPTDPTQMIGVCSSSIQSSYAMPIECQLNADCVGTDGKNFYAGSCQCGMNPNGKAYCAPFWNDLPGITLRNTMTLAYSHSDRCNTVRRYTSACFNVTGSLNRMKAANFGFYYYAQLQGNDRCVKSVFTATYWLNSAVLTTLTAFVVLSAF